MSTNSLHTAEVFRVSELFPHPNADRLELVRFYGYQTCVQKGTFKIGDRAVFIPPDTLVDPTRPEFDFLLKDARSSDGKARVKTIKLRGELSQGLLVPAPGDSDVGQDVWEQLSLLHYEPDSSGPGVGGDKINLGGEEEDGPDLDTGVVHYDIESLERYKDLFNPGELVETTEKIDGSNARYVFHAGRFWVKSRKRWVKRVPDYSHITLEFLHLKGIEPERAKEIYEKLHSAKGTINEFWRALELQPSLMSYLEANPGTTVFGEVFGHNKKMKYGPAGQLLLFDVYRGGKWIDRSEWDVVPSDLATPFVWPERTWDFDFVKSLASGPSFVAATAPFREGVVVKPVVGRMANFGRHYGRLVLKSVSPEYHALKRE